MSQSAESYGDIVWRQFKKNRAAYAALWLLLPLFLTAVFAPALASDIPFVYSDENATIYPWWNFLFNPPSEQFVDFIFNMVLLAFFPWLLISLVANQIAKRRGVPGRRRLSLSLIGLFALVTILTLMFSLPQRLGLSGIQPANRYSARTFVVEQFESDTAAAWYPPIPFGPTSSDLDFKIQPPLSVKPAAEWVRVTDRHRHWLGTETSGRDVLAHLIHGTRISMTVGFVAVSIYLSIGIIVGALAGYFGGWWDTIISRIIEIVLLFPAFFLILTLVGLLNEPSIYIPMVVIGITGWPTIARMIRGEVLKQRSLDYTMAAQALGATNLRIVFRHILPNAIGPALVAAPFGIASAIVTEAGLSLLGFGVRPPTPTWGTLLKLASENYSLWWLVVMPASAIFLTVTVFNLVGSGLRDAMDPRLRI